MAYSVKNDFYSSIQSSELDKLITPTADEVTAGITSDAILNDAIEKADNLIDSYITNQVKELPLETVPVMINKCSVDIAIFFLHGRIQYNEIPGFVETRYLAAEKYLKDISSGKANILINTEEEEAEDRIEYEANCRIFNRGSF